MIDFTKEEKVLILARIRDAKKGLLELKIASTDALRDAIEDEALLHEQVMQKILRNLREIETQDGTTGQMSLDFDKI